MLAFVVPLKSAKISRDWPLMCQLFERSLRALCNQTVPDFRVVVVCNERPQTGFSHPSVHYIEVDFPPPMPDPNEERTGGYELARSKDIERKNADKARKIRVGLEYAARYQPTHSMVVDADDLVNRKLAAFVKQNPKSAGWYFKKGYFYTEGGRFLYLNRQNFNVVCGTSVVVSYPNWEVLFSKPDFYQHAFYEAHSGLVPLPFPGAVYSMANGDNIYMSADTRDQIYSSLLKRIFSAGIVSLAKKAISYRPTMLTVSKRQEFGLFPISPTSRSEAPALTSTQA